MAFQHDIGAYIKGVQALDNTSATAGGAGDATEVDGTTIDRDSFTSSYHSAKLIVGCKTTLGASETLSIAANFQDSPDGSTWTDYGTALASTVVATGSVTDGTAVAELDVDLQTADRYIRVQVTPDLSAGATDTAEIAGIVVLGGADVNPAA